MHSALIWPLGVEVSLSVSSPVMWRFRTFRCCHCMLWPIVLRVLDTAHASPKLQLWYGAEDSSFTTTSPKPSQRSFYYINGSASSDIPLQQCQPVGLHPGQLSLGHIVVPGCMYTSGLTVLGHCCICCYDHCNH